MSFRSRLTYFLAHRLKISHTQARQMLSEGRVKLNGKTTRHNENYTPYCEIKADDTLVSKAHLFTYAMYYKPRGVECTFNLTIPNNLAAQLPKHLKGMYHVGRLDKNSEGLLLFTNDGNLHNKLMLPEAHIQKIYLVETEQPITSELLNGMKNGVELNGKIAFAKEVQYLSDYAFRIVLTQGMNRQIRRVCFKLGNYVTKLTRIQLGNLELGNLQASQYRWVKREDIF
jgi:23S rRNA pseudouridine2604 synthase